MMIVKYDLYSYVIGCTEYEQLKDKLNKEHKTILSVKPTFVAGMMSDGFVIHAVDFDKKTYVKEDVTNE